MESGPDGFESNHWTWNDLSGGTWVQKIEWTAPSIATAKREWFLLSRPISRACPKRLYRIQTCQPYLNAPPPSPRFSSASDC